MVRAPAASCAGALCRPSADRREACRHDLRQDPGHYRQQSAIRRALSIREMETVAAGRTTRPHRDQRHGGSISLLDGQTSRAGASHWRRLRSGRVGVKIFSLTVESRCCGSAGESSSRPECSILPSPLAQFAGRGSPCFEEGEAWIGPIAHAFPGPRSHYRSIEVAGFGSLACASTYFLHRPRIRNRAR